MLIKESSSKIDAIIDEGIYKNIYGGAVLGIASKEELLFLKARGHSRIEPNKRMMKEDDIFDLASLTKPIVTSTSILLLVQKGVISLDESVANHFNEWEFGQKKQITFRHLLTHSSGLPGWLPTYAIANSKEETIDLIKGLDLIYNPGEKIEYSDLGFMLLGHLIEKISGNSLDQFAEENIFKKLNMKESFYLPYLKNELSKDRLVYNERDSLVEKGMCSRGNYSFNNWRQGFEVGYPNDGNCRYSFNGVSGHAGLFSKVEDILRFGQSYLKALAFEDSLLAPAIAKLAIKNHTKHLSANKGLGWFVVDNGLKNIAAHEPTSSEITFKLTSPYPQSIANSSGELFSDKAFGHTGFTGTSIWIDPIKEIIVVFFTNRLHPEASSGILNIRARLHNVILSNYIK